MPDPYGLFGQHVRLRLADKPPNARHCTGDRFGFLVDLNSPTVVGLHDRDDLGHIRACWLDGYQIQTYPFRRVHVFFYPYREDTFWTWCREVGGAVLDSYSGLSRYDSQAEAQLAAQEWLDETLKSDADRRTP